MSDLVLRLNSSSSARQNAAIQLLVQVFVAPHAPELQVGEGSELSLSTSSSSTAQTGSFYDILSTLLNKTGQTAEALGTSQPDSEDGKAVKRWTEDATSSSQTELDLKALDEALKSKTFIAGHQLTAADVALYGNLHAYMAQASHDTLLSHPNVTRHFDLIQHTPSVESAVSKLPSGTFSPSVISIDLDNVPTVERKYESAKKDKKEKAAAAAAAAGGEVASEKADAKGKGRGKKEAAAAAGEGGDEKAPSVNVNQEVGQGKAGDVAGNKKEKKEKAKKEAGDAAASGTPDTARRPKKEKGGEAGGGGSGGAAAPADDVLSPGLIDLRVGLIVDVKKHPDADSLYVEQIDVGEAEPRTVVSGLVNYIPIEEMRNKYLVAVCNLKPANMRGVKSFAMVLAATSKDGKEGMGSVELVQPPEGSAPGDRVYFEGFEDVKALEQLPPKKKIFETIQPGFTTLETREAAWVAPAQEGESGQGKVHRIRTDKGYCLAPTFVGASLS